MKLKSKPSAAAAPANALSRRTGKFDLFMRDLSKKRNLPARFLYAILKNWQYYIIVVPAVVFFLIFSYYPMYGVVVAFKDFRAIDGILGSKWVGLKHFKKLFRSVFFPRMMKNTLKISFLRLIFCFPAPIFLAIILNELRSKKFLRVFQTLSYLPHFMSWVVMGSIFTLLLDPGTGAVNKIIEFFGGESIYFLTDEKWFVPVLIITDIWKGIGWGSILYIASITGIDTEMFEAAELDGASRWQRIWYIILPSLKTVILTMFIMNCSGILSAGFDQIFNMYNEAVYSVADIIDTYVYRVGLVDFDYGLSTATGFFKNVVGCILLILVNEVSKKLNEGKGLY